MRCYFDISELLVSFTSPDDVQIQKDILNRVSTYCNKPVTDYRDDEFVNPYQWTFYHAVFFAFIVCSTLGKREAKIPFKMILSVVNFVYSFNSM